MGCDIHFYVERQRDDGTWEYVKPPPDPFWVERGHPEWSSWYSDRSYDTFAILADVRNGYGFAGCDTGDGFNIITEPRGVPDGISPEVMKHWSLSVLPDDFALDEDDYRVDRATAERWVKEGSSYWIDEGQILSHPDWHSATWLTVAELLAFDWNQTTKHRGIVRVEAYRKWAEKGRKGAPDSYCGGMSGDGVTPLTNEEMDEYLTKDPPRGVIPITAIEWEETYAVSAGRFHAEVIPALTKLGDPARVRAVFWFDN